MRELRRPAARYAQSKFFTDRNDIIFFIEDTDKSTKKVYKEILKNIFVSYNISDIFPLGGRVEVINQCRKSMLEGKDEKAIYIVDGDLYTLCGENYDIFGNLDELNNLFVLSRYCIENYLLEEEAILEVMDEDDCVRDYNYICEELRYSEWLENNTPLFKELYINYAIAKGLCSGIPTIGYGINKLVSSNSGILDKEKVDKRNKYMKNELIKLYGLNIYNDRRKIVEANIGDKNNFLLQYVSGKDHLFTLLMTRMKRITKLKCDYSTYKVRMAKKVVPKEFTKIVDLVNSLYA